MASLCGRLNQQFSSESEFEFVFDLGEALKFSYRSLQVATTFFSNHNRIDLNCGAETHRGVLPNGTLIAVSKCRPGGMGYDQVQTALGVMPYIRHPNFNPVIGYCVAESHLFLVQGYTSNGILSDLLRDKEKRETMFNWPMRVAVCNGIARAISHLHQQINPQLIHRNIKSSNVLLDSSFTPKITGFEDVKFVYESPLEEEYDLVMGTLGYLDPEYLATSKCTPKSDVFGFGVLMLEIITGRKVIYYDIGDDAHVYLVQVALDLLAKDKVLEVVDPVLADFPVHQVLGFMDVAFSCLKKESRSRPSMGEVIQMLNRVFYSSPLTPFEMQQPKTPYFSAASSFRSSSAQTYDEIEGESSVEDGESSVERKETTKLQAQVEVKEAIETSANYSNTINLAERQSKTTMVFERPTVGRGEYAAYARKKNVMPRNKA